MPKENCLQEIVVIAANLGLWVTMVYKMVTKYKK